MRSLAVAVFILAQHCFSQGTVNFSNHSSDILSPPDRLVRFHFSATNINPAFTPGAAVYSNGTPGLRAQLYYGPSVSSEDGLVAVNDVPVTFRASTSGNVGTWAFGTRTLSAFGTNSFGAGMTARLQVRVWDTNLAPTYNAAAAMGNGYTGLIGKSAVFSYTVPTPPAPPTAFNMANFQGFLIGLPLAPTDLSSSLSFGSFSSNGAFQFSLTGAIGFSYVIQVNTNLSTTNWVPLQTNVAPFNFVDESSLLYTQRFYRVVFQSP